MTPAAEKADHLVAHGIQDPPKLEDFYYNSDIINNNSQLTSMVAGGDGCFKSFSVFR